VLGGTRFRHALTREAIYRDLMKRERRLLHLELAEALVALHGGDPSWAAEIERQFADAGAADRALPFAIAAGEEALRLLAPSEAVAHFERAVDASGAQSVARAQALLGLGNAYRLQLQVTKAVTTLKEAAALYQEAGTPEEVARAQSALARAYPFGRDEWARLARRVGRARVGGADRQPRGDRDVDRRSRVRVHGRRRSWAVGRDGTGARAAIGLARTGPKRRSRTSSCTSPTQRDGT